MPTWWITAGSAWAQWKARSARRYPPPLQPPPPNQAICGRLNPGLLDPSCQAKHHPIDPRKHTPGGRHQIGTPAGFKSESVAGFLLECMAGFVRISNCITLFGAPGESTPQVGSHFRDSHLRRRPVTDPLLGTPYQQSDAVMQCHAVGAGRFCQRFQWLGFSNSRRSIKQCIRRFCKTDKTLL